MRPRRKTYDNPHARAYQLPPACAHDNPSRIMATALRCYQGPVADDQNPAAHGGTTHEEQCLRCGAVRRVNSNGVHVECSPWSYPSD